MLKAIALPLTAAAPLLFGAGVAIGAPAVAATVSAAASPAMERLGWLAGCWRLEGGEPGSGEQWSQLAGNTLLGTSCLVRQGATAEYEFMQIRQVADGNVVFAALPQGRAETLFTLMGSSRANEAVFENPAIEFPQRIIYRLLEGGRMRARIEGQRSGVLAGVDFAFLRTACDALPPTPEAFQGLSWGASESQMRLRFGPELKTAECPLPGRQIPLRQGEACDHPTLPRYVVAGLPFRLNLIVDERTRQLVRVSLAWAGEGAQAAATESGNSSGWSEKHRHLRQLLTQRYGSPEATQVNNEASNYTATARWRRGDTLIELHSLFETAAGKLPARERVEIVYQPSASGEAGRL
jgi:hypothetical protein